MSRPLIGSGYAGLRVIRPDGNISWNWQNCDAAIKMKNSLALVSEKLMTVKGGENESDILFELKI